MKSLLVLLLVLSPIFAFAAPGQVLMIRHGEKDSDEDPHLSARGKARAEALVKFFEHDPSVSNLGLPVAIYAAAPKHDDSSLRSIETIGPLAKDLKLKINEDFTADDHKALAKEILKSSKYEGKTVIVVWAHDELHKLAKNLGVRPAPDKWKKKAFDRVWKITFPAGGDARLVDIPQHVLPGDSSDIR